MLQEKYTNAFLGFWPEDQDYFSLELTYNYGVDSYDLGTGFGHFALAVPDVYKTVESIKSAGVQCGAVLSLGCCFVMRRPGIPFLESHILALRNRRREGVARCRSREGRQERHRICG